MNRLAKLGASARALRLPGVRPCRWWLAALAAESALPAGTVWITRRIASDWSSEGTAAWALLLAGAVAGGELLRTGRAWLSLRQAAGIRDAVTGIVHAKSIRVGLSFHDDAAFHESLHVARVQAPDQAAALVEGMGAIGQGLASLLFLGAILTTVSSWLPAIVAAAMVPLLVTRLLGSIRLHEWRRRHQEPERRAWYCDYLLTCAEPAPELRLYGWGDRVRNRYRDLRALLRQGESSIHRRNTLEQGAAFLFAALVCAAGWPLLRGGATDLPEALTAAQTCYYGFSLTQPLIASIGTVYSAALLLANFSIFLRLPETRTAGPSKPPAPLREGIRFRDVSFRYTNAAKPALDHLDLFLPAGEITAIVGPNGSGKSTLVKLLCGLYEPSGGSIEFDGEPAQAAWVSAMFQQPVRFQDTLAVNIAPAGAVSSHGPLLAAAHRAGLDSKIDTWPDRLGQLLGNQFPGGTELSGGEWQKVALARALYRDCPILVLDEPTSMMDPRAEAEFLAALRRHAGNRTIVIITHRRTVADAADRVIEMSGGRARDFSQVN